MAFLDINSLNAMGFKSLGSNVLISDKASIYNAANISIGNNVRIDDFCILSAGDGGIEIGNNIHVACYVSMIGAGKITLEDYTNVAARTNILSSNDDYSGKYLIGPCNDSGRNVIDAPVTLKKYSITGVGCVVLPGVTIEENTVLGALSLANRDLEPNSIYGGVPAKRLKSRQQLIVETV